MYKSIFLFIAAVTVFLTVSCSAHAQKPDTYGNIAYEGADLLSAPDLKAKAIGHLYYGEIVEFIEDTTGSFIKARNIATGDEGYIETQKIDRAKYPLLAPELSASEPKDDPYLQNIKDEPGGEIVEGWSFWKEGEKVRAFNMIRLIHKDGRSRTIEHYYIGEEHPGYLLLTEEVMYGAESGEKLETPIVIYEDIANRAGVFSLGKCFTPGGRVGGFDTDGWE